MNKIITRKKKILITVLLLLLLLTASYFLYMEEQGNFHAITHGEAYRSAQLDRDELEYYINRHNIRSIINLRGEHPDKPWYREETEVSLIYGVRHYSIPLSSSFEPDEAVVRKLIEVYNNAPRPVLIHCQAGADRSGLASAIWKVVVDKESKSVAEKQLSIFYGHLPIGKAQAMDSFFRKWNPS
jgi:protein tyrosine/serine phosphatase